MNFFFKIIVFLVSVFLLIGCGINKFTFENKNILIKSKIKENHQVIDNKLVKLDGLFCLSKPEDLKNMKDNFSIVFYDKKLVEYNFIISFSKVTCLNDYHFDAKVININISGLHKVEIKNLSNSNINYYVYEKKIKNGYIQFGNTSKSEIDLNFLLQKFNEIKIIEK
jgi:hypothetical protein